MTEDPDAVRRIMPWPTRPPVRAGRLRYEIVRPAALPAVLSELQAYVYAQPALTPDQRDLLFARAAAAAAVNALLDP